MNSRLIFLAGALLLALALAGGAASPLGASTGFPPPSATICPQSVDPAKGGVDRRTDASATCYFLPEIYMTPSSGTVAVNQTFTFTLEVRYSEYGCTKSGSWSGSVATDSAGHYGPQSVTVGPFGSAGTYTFGLSCGGLGGTTAGSTTVTVTAPGGGGSGSGGGAGCTENLTSQMHATFSSQSGVPATVTAGQSFTASITFQNTGSCTWTAANGYRLGSQNPENNTTWGTSRLYLGGSEAIAPGQSKTFTINAVAPSTAGTYGWGWRMLREGVNWMGTPSNGSFTSINVTGSVPPQGGTSPVGAVADVDLNGIATGWACDSDNFNASLTVNFYVDGALTSSTPASVNRSDVASQCGGTSAHGFSYSLPLSFWDGKQHALTVVASNIGVGSDVALPGSPRNFVLAQNGVTTFADGWTESTYDGTGSLVSQRSGTFAAEPYVNLSDTRMLQGLSSGCRTLAAYVEARSSIFHTLVYRFYQVKHWCWKYPAINTVNCNANPVSCLTFTDDISNVASTESYAKVQSSVSYYYNWGGSSKGGHYSKITGKFDNCVFKYGCIGSSYPWVEIYTVGNGAWQAFGGGT
jgi:hypothetical protein